MKRFREWVFIVGLTSVFSTFGAEALNSQAPASTNLVGADALWAGMHEQGMISDEQYRFVLQTGHLPGGTTVSNSPVAAESQGNWNLLAKEEVITPDELAAMLFDGDIPGLTEEEEQAFIELAPVYQPKRSKRLTYDVRSKPNGSTREPRQIPSGFIKFRKQNKEAYHEVPLCIFDLRVLLGWCYKHLCGYCLVRGVIPAHLSRYNLY